MSGVSFRRWKFPKSRHFPPWTLTYNFFLGREKVGTLVGLFEPQFH